MRLSKREQKKYSSFIYYRSDLKFFEDNTKKIMIYNERGEKISHKNFIKLESKDVFVRNAFRILNFINREILNRSKNLEKILSGVLLGYTGKTGRYFYKISKGGFKEDYKK